MKALPLNRTKTRRQVEKSVSAVNKFSMGLIGHTLAFLAALPATGLLGPRILCIENDGTSSVELASVQCCNCCPGTIQLGPINATLCGGPQICDDAAACTNCTDVLLMDEATHRRPVPLDPPNVSFAITAITLTSPFDAGVATTSMDGYAVVSREGAWPTGPGSVILRI